MKSSPLATTIRIFSPILVLAIAAAFTYHLLQTGPQARPRPPQRTVNMVETIPLHFGEHKAVIRAMGTVKASETVALKPQVSGNVTSLQGSFIPGGNFETGDILLQINKLDYELALMQEESGVEQAKINLELENGNQVVAKRELALLGEQVSDEERRLILREPQLRNLQTALKIAETKKEKALLNLQRTTITAPFNGIIQSRDVNIGTWVTTSTTLATLVGTDRFWVEISLPEEQLQWISFPDEDGQGSAVTIYNPIAWGKETFREGHIIQLLPALEAESRMARLLIEIVDPLALQEKSNNLPKLLLDSYVRVVIEGKSIVQSLKLPRKYLRGGKDLWIFSNKGRLDIREAVISFAYEDSVLITEGVREGEQLITSAITTAVDNMPLTSAASQPTGRPGFPGTGMEDSQRAGKRPPGIRPGEGINMGSGPAGNQTRQANQGEAVKPQ